jgi:hypothetical protein
MKNRMRPVHPGEILREDRISGYYGVGQPVACVPLPRSSSATLSPRHGAKALAPDLLEEVRGLLVCWGGLTVPTSRPQCTHLFVNALRARHVHSNLCRQRGQENIDTSVCVANRAPKLTNAAYLSPEGPHLCSAHRKSAHEAGNHATRTTKRRSRRLRRSAHAGAYRSGEAAFGWVLANCSIAFQFTVEGAYRKQRFYATDSRSH